MPISESVAFGQWLRAFLEDFRGDQRTEALRAQELELPATYRPNSLPNDRVVPTKTHPVGPADAGYFFLEPPKPEWQPVVSLSHDCTQALPVVRFRVAMFDRTALQPHCGAAFRLETPECRVAADGEESEDGQHDYFHMQWIAEMRKGSGRLPGMTGEVAVKTPAIPIDAIDGSSMVLCLSLAIYGPDRTRLLMKARGLKSVGDSHFLRSKFRDPGAG